MRMLFLVFCVFSVFTIYSEQNVKENIAFDEFFQQYPESYQDIVIQNQVVQQGYYICDKRLDFIRPILNQYDRPFSVLDIGACEGYFSFRIAEEYSAYCTMIEGGYYQEKSPKVLSLCNFNNHLTNICLLNEKLNLNSLRKFSQKEHFDVVLAFLVVHQMAEQEANQFGFLECVKRYIHWFLELGDNVILETTIQLYPDLDQYVRNLCEEMGGVFLGEMSRCRTTTNHPDVRFYWFRNNSNVKSNLKISKKTFEDFHGVYPLDFGER